MHSIHMALHNNNSNSFSSPINNNNNNDETKLLSTSWWHPRWREKKKKINSIYLFISNYYAGACNFHNFMLLFKKIKLFIFATKCRKIIFCKESSMKAFDVETSLRKLFLLLFFALQTREREREEREKN